MKVCFRLDHELVEKDTGRALLFRLPNSYNDMVWVPWFLTDSYGCKKYGYLIEVNEDFQFTVKQGDDEKEVKMTPNELLATYQIPHDEEEQRINERIAERQQEIKERKEAEQKYVEEHKGDVKDWSKVKVRLYDYEYVGNGVKMSVKGVEGTIMVPAKLVKLHKKTVHMPKWLADEKQIPAWAQESTVHTPDELEVVENQQPIDDVVIKD